MTKRSGFSGWGMFLFLVLFFSTEAQGQDEFRKLYEMPVDGARYMLHGRVVDGRTCEPAPGVEVIWENSPGELGQLVANEDGEFVAALGDGISWHSTIYARRGNQVSQRATLYGEHSLNFELELGEPATISGTVTGESGEPVAGAHVILTNNLVSQLPSWTAITNEDGYYEIRNVTPGEGRLRIEHETTYLGDDCMCARPKSAVLFPGETTIEDLHVKDLTLYSGHVIGPDGASLPNFEVLYNQSHRKTLNTDANGAFSVYGRPKLSLRVADTVLGTGELHLPAANTGESIDNLVIKLNGWIRITGTVVGPEGNALPDVRVSHLAKNTQTDDNGRFTLEEVPRGKDGAAVKLHLTPPSWRSPFVLPHATLSTTTTFPEKTYYASETVSVQGQHGETINVDVTLSTQIIRTIQGIVRDEDGNPMANVPVIVYRGFARTEQWLGDLTPHLPQPPTLWPRKPYGNRIESGITPAAFLTSTRSDSQGHWKAGFAWGRLHHEAAEKESLPPTPLFIAAGVPGLMQTAVARHTLMDEEVVIEVNLNLVASHEDMAMQVHVVDQAGHPVPESNWGIGGFGPFSSGQDGVLMVPRFSSRIQLKLLDTDCRIESARTTGSIETVPTPERDQEHARSEKRSFVDVFSWIPSGPGIESEVPYIERKDDSVKFHYFDTTKGRLEITLGDCKK